MQGKQRKLMLCCAGHYEEAVPYVLLKGIWFKDYGFHPGDQVIVTNPKHNTLLMEVHKPWWKVDEEREVLETKIDKFIHEQNKLAN